MRKGNDVLIGVAGLNVLLHGLAINRYGYHRDELYFLDCATHLDFGYVDHPPLLEVILAGTRWLLGDSLPAIRLPAVLASTALAVLVVLMARGLGGGRFAQLLAGLAAVLAPVYLVTSGTISVEGLNTLFWALCLYLALLVVRNPTPARWMMLGASFGLGLLAKYAIAFLGAGLAVGVILTPCRRLLRSRWPWFAAMLAFLILHPNLIWQWYAGWPFLAYAAKIQTTMMQWIPLHLYLLFQVIYLNPASLPVWAAGLLYLLLAPAMKPFRVLGVTFLAMLVLLVVVGSKPYYPAPAYTILLAAGAVAAERLFHRPRLRWLRPASVAILLLLSLPMLPYSLPILPIERFLAYSRVFYIKAAFTFETGRILQVPQYFADMFGWENQAEVVARVYQSLSEGERAKTMIYGENYGEAGAINLFGRRYGLPRAVSGHFNYYFWGPGPPGMEVVIAFGGIDRKDVEQDFGDITLAATITHPYAIFYENNIPVYICRKPRAPIEQLWRETRSF